MTDSPPHPFKPFGLQRTGTNLVRAQFAQNFHVEYLEESATGWKHGPSRLADGTWKGRPVRFVLCVRNPYAWAVSCYRFFRRVCDGDVTAPPQFQRDPSMSFDEFMMSPSYAFDTPIHRWNQMNRLWLSTLSAERMVLVRQEDQLDGQMQVLQRAEQHLQLMRRQERLHPIDQRIDVDATVQGSLNREYYLDHEYLGDYSPSLLKHVNQLLDASLMKELGYQLERWTLAARQINGLRLVVRPCSTDARDARDVSFNWYALDPITHSELDIHTVLDFGAGVGAWTLFAKTLWPNCRLWAYEPCPQKLPVLRINTKRLSGVTLLDADIPGIAAAQVSAASMCSEPDCRRADNSQVAGGSDAAILVAVEKILSRCGKVDLLRIGCRHLASQVLQCVISNRTVSQLTCVCGIIAAGDGTGSVLESLRHTHHVETWNSSQGVHFRGDRRQ